MELIFLGFLILAIYITARAQRPVGNLLVSFSRTLDAQRSLIEPAGEMFNEATSTMREERRKLDPFSAENRPH